MTVPEVAPLDTAQRDAVRALAAESERRESSPPLSDAALARLGSPDARHWRTGDGYAQLADGSLELLAVDPAALADLVTTIEHDVPGSYLVWSHGSAGLVSCELASRGYTRVRVLHRLLRSLDGLPPPRPLPGGITLAAFRPGIDEQAWLRTNAAAFAAHPEQGRWTRADIEDREHEPWFRAGDVLLAWDGGTLRGFHWMKIHPNGDGEVYVLGVDPSAQGTGLGGALLDAGLHHLAGRGCAQALLYVDEDNRTAMLLYERSGFGISDTDVQWRRPAPSG